MSALAEFQRALARHVLTGAPEIAGLIAETPGFARAARLGVYHEAYRVRLAEALAADFPGLAALLGSAAFRELAQAYVTAHPSHSYTLRDLGHALVGFLARSGRHRRRPWLREMAAFEWALVEAFDAADAVALSAADLAALAPADLVRRRFVFQPALRVVRLRWDVPALWHAAQSGQALPAPRRLPAPASCLVWRRAARVYFRTLGADEAGMLKALRAGRSFAAGCGALARVTRDPDPARRAAVLLATWAQEELICAR